MLTSICADPHCRYPMITVSAVNVLQSCHEICSDQAEQHCTAYLRVDYSIECYRVDAGVRSYNSRYEGFTVYAGFVLAVLGFLVPLAIARFIYSKTREIQVHLWQNVAV